MAILQRHWRLATALSIFVVLAATWGVVSLRNQTVLAGPEEPVPLTEMSADAIRLLLEDVALDREALIGLNVTSQQAESVLTTVRDWYQRNAAQLASLQADIADAAAALQTIEQAIAMGPAQEGQQQDLANARATLHEAHQDYASALSPLRGDVAEVLSKSQNQTWAAIEASYGSNMPLRLIALSSQQRLDLGRAQRHYQWQLAAATTPQDRSAAVAAWQSALNSILSSEQGQVLDAFHKYQAASSQAVSAAFDSVLAVTGKS